MVAIWHYLSRFNMQYIPPSVDFVNVDQFEISNGFHIITMIVEFVLPGGHFSIFIGLWNSDVNTLR